MPRPKGSKNIPKSELMRAVFIARMERELKKFMEDYKKQLSKENKVNK